MSVKTDSCMNMDDIGIVLKVYEVRLKNWKEKKPELVDAFHFTSFLPDPVDRTDNYMANFKPRTISLANNKNFESHKRSHKE